MLDLLHLIAFGLKTGHSGIFLIVGMIISFAIRFRVRRFRAIDWVLVAASNLHAILLIPAWVKMPGDVVLFLLFATSWGAFGIGWVLGLLLAFVFLQFSKRNDLNAQRP